MPAEKSGSPLWVALTGQSTTIVLGTILPQRLGEAPLRPDGSFEFEDVLPGRYALQLRPGDRFYVLRNIDVTNADVLDLSLTGETRALPVLLP